mgnify:CR=1 FL=1
MTLEPGDLIATGTPRGSDLSHAGDDVTVVGGGAIGSLRNPVVETPG